MYTTTGLSPCGHLGKSSPHLHLFGAVFHCQTRIICTLCTNIYKTFHFNFLLGFYNACWVFIAPHHCCTRIYLYAEYRCTLYGYHYSISVLFFLYIAITPSFLSCYSVMKYKHKRNIAEENAQCSLCIL